MIARLFLFIAGGYALIVALVCVFQRHLQYFPDTRPVGNPRDHDLPRMRAVSVTTEDGLKLAAWFAPPEKEDGRIIVFFHGNGGSIAGRAFKAQHFADKGYGVYLCEYRGFGGNPGRPTEKGLYRDARAGLKWLEDEGYSPARFVLYGESIGTGVAVHMAKETQPKILILEAPFSSAVDVGRLAYPWLPVDLLMRDRFDSLSKIRDIRADLLIVHGDEDETIPLFLAQRLFDAARHPKEFATVYGGGHNDIYEHNAGHIITDWLGARP